MVQPIQRAMKANNMTQSSTGKTIAQRKLSVGAKKSHLIDSRRWEEEPVNVILRR